MGIKEHVDRILQEKGDIDNAVEMLGEQADNSVYTKHSRNEPLQQVTRQRRRYATVYRVDPENPLRMRKVRMRYRQAAYSGSDGKGGEGTE
jgi:IS5 family transposase